MPFLISGLVSWVTGSEAADAQKDAANAALKNERQMYDTTRADLAPYRDTGVSALTKYADSLGLNGDAARDQFRTDFRTDPGYQFSFDEGQRAVQGSAAARSGLLSGGAMKALSRFGTGLADQQYGSYLDRYSNLANMGQNSAAMTGQLGNASAGRQGAYLTDAGAAQAGGYLAQGNAVNGAITNMLKTAGRLVGGGGFG